MTTVTYWAINQLHSKQHNRYFTISPTSTSTSTPTPTATNTLKNKHHETSSRTHPTGHKEHSSSFHAFSILHSSASERCGDGLLESALPRGDTLFGVADRDRDRDRDLSARLTGLLLLEGVLRGDALLRGLTLFRAGERAGEALLIGERLRPFSSSYLPLLRSLR